MRMYTTNVSMLMLLHYRTVNIGGRKRRWAGIGLVGEGETDGTEVEIIDG